MPTYELPDADGSVTTFDGELLGSGSSARPGHDRWSEVHIYKTLGGTYLVHKIGRSARPGEVDRFTLHTCTEPQGVVESCKTSDSEGVLFFTRVARDALDAARKEDDELSDAFYRRRLA
jgi:hypothetical protein